MPESPRLEKTRGLTVLADALEHLVRGIVSNPDDVSVKDKDLRRGRMLEVRVNPDDIGKVIGRSGRTATALRTVITALAGRKSGTGRLRGCGQAGPPRLRRRTPPSVTSEREVIEVVVGVIGRAHGIRGEVVVAPRTDEPERRFAPGQQLRVEGSANTFTVVSRRDHSGRVFSPPRRV